MYFLNYLKLKRPIILNPTIFAEIIYYGEAIDLNPADIAGWGAVRVRKRPKTQIEKVDFIFFSNNERMKDCPPWFSGQLKWSL